MTEENRLIAEMLADPRHGWSIGTFGAIGEFARDEDEPAAIEISERGGCVITARGGIRVAPVEGLRAIAFDTLASDADTWGQAVAFCLPAPARMEHGRVGVLGPDADALREEDRGAMLFDLGVGRGHVRFAARTRDEGLIGALAVMEGKDLFGPEGGAVMGEVLRAQPHRVVLSPAGRVEVYSPIPLPGGSSPEGPHTHLLPQMIAARRTHAANAPIPEDMQPVLNLHPRSPWRDGMGRRVPFDSGLDALFDGVLARFGREEDRAVREAVEAAVAADVAPDDFDWPQSRRGRSEARIALRRIARTRGASVAAWRQKYDRLPEPEAEEEAALHS